MTMIIVMAGHHFQPKLERDGQFAIVLLETSLLITKAL
jgi:hypothetical protein